MVNIEYSTYVEAIMHSADSLFDFSNLNLRQVFDILGIQVLLHAPTLIRCCDSHYFLRLEPLEEELILRCRYITLLGDLVKCSYDLSACRCDFSVVVLAAEKRGQTSPGSRNDTMLLRVREQRHEMSGDEWVILHLGFTQIR